MPGVPSGRGCDACRKQKKKCDQGKPACARCTRLRIQCVGSGQRRFKFKEQNVIVASKNGQTSLSARDSPSDSASRKSSKSPPSGPQSIVFAFAGPPQIPGSNKTTGAFVSLLQITDLRYSLDAFGDILHYLPRRLGTSQVLDDSVEALICAYSSYHSRHEHIKALTAYVKVIKTLRSALIDPIQSGKVETLCAVYVVMVCQTFMAREDDCETNHGEALAHIMNALVGQGRLGELESKAFLNLLIPTIMESVVNRRLELHPALWDMVNEWGPPSSRLLPQKLPWESFRVSKLAEMARLARDPDDHFEEIQACYHGLRLDTPRFARFIFGLTDPDSDNFTTNQKTLTEARAALAVILSLTSTFNGILRAFGSTDPQLWDDMTGYVEDTLVLAEVGLPFRPLGSSYVPLPIISTWAVTDVPMEQAKLNSALVAYADDFVGAKWFERAVWQRAWLEKMRQRLSAMLPDSAMPAPPFDVDMESIMGAPGSSCTIL